MKLAAYLAATAALVVLLLVPLPLSALAHRWPALVNAIQDAMHAPAFALFTVVAYDLLRRRFAAPSLVPWAACAMLMPAAGLLTEWLQSLTGRDASWADLRTDVLGVAFGLAVVAIREQRGRQRGPLARPALVFAAAGIGFLAIAPLSWTLAAYAARWHAHPLIWTPDSRLLGHFSHSYVTGRWSGLALTEVPADWSRSAALEVRVRNLTPVPQRVSVRVHDATHDNRYEDRFQQAVTLPPDEARLLRFPMEAIRSAPKGRKMDLRHMQNITVFRYGDRQPAHFRVEMIRLSPIGDSLGSLAP